MLINVAAAFALAAHAGQTRKYTGLPYFTHCASVANLARHFGGNDTVIAAAWLHDVLEDCPNITSDTMLQAVPLEVVQLVFQLTKRPNIDYNKQLENADEFAQFIKVCDIMDNCKDSPDITYIKSKLNQLNYLNKAPYALVERAKHLLEKRLNTLRSLHDSSISNLGFTPGTP